MVTIALLAVASCGSDVGEGSGTATVQVESVRMQQSGGLAGVERTWRVGSGTPGSERVFAAAQQEAIGGAAGVVTPECCDMFVYTIWIRYSDGQTIRLDTSDATETDPAVTELMNAIFATEPSPAPELDGGPPSETG